MHTVWLVSIVNLLVWQLTDFGNPCAFTELLIRPCAQHATCGLQEQVSEEGSLGEPQGTGIVLRRKKRDDSSPSKAGDALAIAELVQKLCQVHIPGDAYFYWKLDWRAASVVHNLCTCVTSMFWLLCSGCNMGKKICSWFVFVGSLDAGSLPCSA